ncbi:type I-E CRISPR-associated protein Cas5/CasD [Desulfosudis oleivorans]|uniref:CRISPR-associated protein Cas5 family n=1 Tax=Desulfosudis oleivorans (strain DSM 6200 / JCM 39069 / Hxd3) TaxID=96561 RepID=A8ZZ17_DESOH|nr:type I-E CRISPR-associated protein Cas5/CasD [Desulfosudis oleivorans]ABW68790.1 CRISPR-associated protein Cas5 family [Desulfosudis oleivorans Hxd3]
MGYLLFRLYGPMASWGEIAVGETRHTANYPGRSAIIGLMAAALGIKRSETENQQALDQGCLIAVEARSHGSLLRDYHTTQVPDSVGGFVYRTRRDELIIGKPRLGTILSSREYRQDALAVSAVRVLPGARYELQTIKTHLEQPRLHVYLGRKSCPLSAPMNPQIDKTSRNFHEAFQAYAHQPLLPVHHSGKEGLSKRDAYWLGLANDRHYYWEGEPSEFSDTIDLSRVQTRIRHDQPLSRTRWQFSPRQEHYWYFSGGE